MFLKFFESKGHKRLPGASLVPKDDPTLLLTGAGMVPFKPYFLGKARPESTRATTCQPCMRTPDIDNVGKTDRHGTFFEMLGNFSFGDYFKEEAIPWAWEFVTEYLKIPGEKLWVTIYLDDDEAFEIWNKKVGVPAERIVRLGKDTNFWEIGVGPCGPCSEIFVDRGPGYGCGEPDCDIECGCDRFMEIWNLVFIQYHKDEAGEYHLLPKKSIDTGMGLERTSAYLQGVTSIMEVDHIQPIVNFIAGLAGTKYGADPKNDVSIRVITDHARGVTFMVKDGILPDNEGRGYVLRRLLRRAARYGRLLGIEGSFLPKVARVVVDQMQGAYPELVERRDYLLKVIAQEEEHFQSTLDQGMSLLSQIIEKVKGRGGREIEGQDAFRLHDTYGFPLELTREIAAEQGLGVDEAGFAGAMEEQRQRARAARQETGYLGKESAVFTLLGQRLGTEFVGYDRTEVEGKIVAIARNGQEVAEAASGQEAEIILDATPFYAESGGQVADTGTITGVDGQFKVDQVRKPMEGLFVHKGLVTAGGLRVGDRVLASVYGRDRLATARNHSATHLLHKALKIVLGNHANQAGSLVTPDRLRFDFTHFAPVTDEELFKVEKIVNEMVMANLPITTQVTTLEQAMKMEATALFGEKYGDVVRVVSMGDFSTELCGGTHLKATGQIGLFKILSENGIAAGTRRIEAVTGKGALEEMDAREKALRSLCDRLKVAPENVVERVEKLLADFKDLEREATLFKRKMAVNKVGELLNQAIEVAGVKAVVATVEHMDAEALRDMGDQLRARLGSGVVVLGTAESGKVSLVAMATPDAVSRGVHAGNLLKAAAKVAGGGGGGRPDMAQAGGKDPAKLAAALDTARDLISQQLQ
ncbi:MAG: alanine--tRNA ligase [Firmicutes bacterium]|nr:alanine--tRNA ligase [Bacillota bacterium]